MMSCPLKIKGFTLLELMLAATIIVVAMAGLLGAYVLCFNINETAKNLTLATAAAQEEIETIRNSAFTNISNASTDNPPGFEGATFNVTGLPAGNAMGSVRVDSANPDLLKITVSVSWRQRGGRIIGEDNGRGGGIALNGRRDGAEDVNGNNVMDSPACIEVLMANR